MFIICPKCNAPVGWNSWFRTYLCRQCGWEKSEPKEDIDKSYLIKELFSEFVCKNTNCNYKDTCKKSGEWLNACGRYLKLEKKIDELIEQMKET